MEEGMGRECGRRRRLVAGVVFAIAAAVLLSCDSVEKVPVDPQAVAETVRDYNTALVQAYQDGNYDYLRPFATEYQMSRLFPTFQYLDARRSRMHAVQKVFEVKEAGGEGDQAAVRTYETWVYWWTDLRTGQKTRETSFQVYNLTYELKRVGPRWKVDNIIIEGQEDPASREGMVPFPGGRTR